MNNCGYATTKKWDLYEAQMRHGLKDLDVIKDFDILEFQRQDLALFLYAIHLIGELQMRNPTIKSYFPISEYDIHANVCASKDTRPTSAAFENRKFALDLLNSHILHNLETHGAIP